MSFGFYKACTIQAAQCPSSQSNFPALLPFLDATDNDLRTVGNGGHVQHGSGFDIRPYADSALTTPLTFELVPGTYSPTTGKFEMWVNMTAVNGGIVYLAYGDSGISTDGSSSSTWDANFKGVWHLPNGSTLTTLNSSQGGATYDASNVGTSTASARQIDGAGVFNGSSQYLTIPTGIEVSGLTAYTIEGWFKMSSSAGATVYGEGYSVGGTPIVMLTINDAGTGDAEFFHRPDSGGTADMVYTASLNDDVLHHIAGVRIAAQSFALYVDGVLRATDVANNPGSTPVDQLTIGALRRTTTGLYMTGSIDEVRVSHVARSADWIATEFNNATLSTFWSKGSETATAAGPLVHVWEPMPRPYSVRTETIVIQ